jgi:hypothetical protein
MRCLQVLIVVRSGANRSPHQSYRSAALHSTSISRFILDEFRLACESVCLAAPDCPRNTPLDRRTRRATNYTDAQN